MKFQFPVDVNRGGYIIQPFGAHNRDYAPLLGHPGIDYSYNRLDGGLGEPVPAVCDGWVYAAVSKDDGFGIHLYQWYEENGKQYVVVYGHFSRPFFPVIPASWSKAIPIKRGQIVGFMGSTGFSNAVHVHIGVQEWLNGQLLNGNNGYGGAIDFTAQVLPESDFKLYMSNVVFVHKTGSSEYGFYLPKLSEDALKDMVLNLGRQDLLKADGSVDFSLAKEISL